MIDKSILTRKCAVCGNAISDGKGLYTSHVRVLVHLGVCSERLEAVERIFDRSKRGRWRPVSEIRKMLRDGTLP